MEDVTLDRLWRPVHKTSYAGRPVTVRAISGSEQDARAMYAVKTTRALERKLSDHESDEYQFRLRYLDGLDEPALLLRLKTRYENEIRPDIEKENPLDYIPVPDDATDDEKRANLDARDKAEQDHKDRINRLVQAKLDAYTEKNLTGKIQEQLLEMSKNQIIFMALSEESSNSIAYYSLFLSVYNPDGTRYFESAEEARSAGFQAALYLYKKFEEVNNINPLDLSGSSSTAALTTSS